jgi:hypothetical protein
MYPFVLIQLFLLLVFCGLALYYCGDAQHFGFAFADPVVEEEVCYFNVFFFVLEAA